MKKILLAGLATGLMVAGSTGIASAIDYDFAGELAYHNDVLMYSFTTTSPRDVTLFSSSWDDGNFDPMLGLWDSSGNLITWQDDGGRLGTTSSNSVLYTHGNWDSYYTENLAAGTYTVTISTYYNAPKGNSLSAGFAYDSETPIAIASWDQPANGIRGDDFVFHVLGADSAVVVSDVPEPATMLLFGAGIVGLAAVGRRKGSK